MSNCVAVCRSQRAQPLHTTSATSPGVPEGPLQRCTPATLACRGAASRSRARPPAAGPRAAAYQESHRVEAPHEAGGRGRARCGRPATATLTLLLLLHAGGGAGLAQCPRRGGNERRRRRHRRRRVSLFRLVRYPKCVLLSGRGWGRIRLPAGLGSRRDPCLHPPTHTSVGLCPFCLLRVCAGNILQPGPSGPRLLWGQEEPGGAEGLWKQICHRSMVVDPLHSSCGGCRKMSFWPLHLRSYRPIWKAPVPQRCCCSSAISRAQPGVCIKCFWQQSVFLPCSCLIMVVLSQGGRASLFLLSTFTAVLCFG